MEASQARTWVPGEEEGWAVEQETNGVILDQNAAECVSGGILDQNISGPRWKKRDKPRDEPRECGDAPE